MSIFKKFLGATLWSLVGQLSYLVLLFISNIILVRHIAPEGFGKIAIISFFISVFNVLVESGLGGALIRRKEISEIYYSTVFVFNLLVSIILYVFLFLGSPFISSYYNDSSLLFLLRLQGINILINAFQIVPNIFLIRNLDFKTINIIKFISILCSSSIGIYLAYSGKGVISLVIMQIANVLVNTIFLNIKTRWFIQFKFSKKIFKEIYSFGVNTTIASLINTVFDNIYNLILSKSFSLHIAGNYYQAKKLQDMPVAIVNNLNQGVFYGFLSKKQENIEDYFRAYSFLLKCLTWGVTFIFLFIFLFAENIIDVFYGDAWLDSAYYLRILCVISFFYLIEQFNRVSFKVFDKTNIILILEVVKKILQTATVIIGLYFMSIDYLLVGYVVVSLISCILNWGVFGSIKNRRYYGELIQILICIMFSVIVYSILKFFTHSLLLDLIIYLLSCLIISVIFISSIKRNRWLEIFK